MDEGAQFTRRGFSLPSRLSGAIPRRRTRLRKNHRTEDPSAAAMCNYFLSRFRTSLFLRHFSPCGSSPNEFTSGCMLACFTRSHFPPLSLFSSLEFLDFLSTRLCCRIGIRCVHCACLLAWYSGCFYRSSDSRILIRRWRRCMYGVDGKGLVIIPRVGNVGRCLYARGNCMSDPF